MRTVPLHLGLPSGSVPYGVFRWTHQGQVLLTAGTEQHPVATALIVDVRTGRVLHRVPVPGDPFEIAPNPAGTWLAEAGQDGQLRFVSIADGRLLGPAQVAVDGLVYNVSVSPDGRYVVTGGAPGQVRIWDTTTFREVGPTLPGPVDAGSARVRFTPDGSLVSVFTPHGRQHRPERRSRRRVGRRPAARTRRVGVPGRASGMVRRCLHSRPPTTVESGVEHVPAPAAVRPRLPLTGPDAGVREIGTSCAQLGRGTEPLSVLGSRPGRACR